MPLDDIGASFSHHQGIQDFGLSWARKMADWVIDLEARATWVIPVTMVELSVVAFLGICRFGFLAIN